LIVGMDGGSTARGRFNGKIGEVICFSRALSAAEIQEIFNNSRKKYGQ